MWYEMGARKQSFCAKNKKSLADNRLCSPAFHMVNFVSREEFQMLKGKQQYIFYRLIDKNPESIVVNFLTTCLVSEILNDKERQRRYSSAILDTRISPPHDVTTWVIAQRFEK